MQQHASKPGWSSSSVPSVGTPPSANPPVPPRQRVKSSIVTFTRPDRTPRDGSEGNVCSQKGAFGSPRDYQPRKSSHSDRNTASSRSFGRSAPQGTTTGFLLPRPEMSPCYQQKGFQTSEDSVRSEVGRSGDLPRKLSGALSREFNEDRSPHAFASSTAVQVNLSGLLLVILFTRCNKPSPSVF